MSDDELRRNAQREQSKLLKLLRKSAPEKAQALRPMCENVGWLKARLDLAREELGAAPITVEYQNGETQRGTTENPAIKAYEGLFRSYLAGMSKILDALPGEAAKVAASQVSEAKQTKLELIRSRRDRAS